eukprot:3961153-Lingulodinium_polyedra.AAC.1
MEQSGKAVKNISDEARQRMKRKLLTGHEEMGDDGDMDADTMAQLLTETGGDGFNGTGMLVGSDVRGLVESPDGEESGSQAGDDEEPSAEAEAKKTKKPKYFERDAALATAWE